MLEIFMCHFISHHNVDRHARLLEQKPKRLKLLLQMLRKKLGDNKELWRRRLRDESYGKRNIFRSTDLANAVTSNS
jgi:hypothetical protein